MSITLRRATRADIALLAGLIERSAHGLSTADYTQAQVAGALRGAFGVDTQLVDDGTYFVAEEDGVLAGHAVALRLVPPTIAARTIVSARSRDTRML